MKKFIAALFGWRLVAAAMATSLLLCLVGGMLRWRAVAAAGVAVIVAVVVVIGLGWRPARRPRPLLECSGNYTDASGTERVPFVFVAPSRRELKIELKRRLAELVDVPANALRWRRKWVLTKHVRVLRKLSLKAHGDPAGSADYTIGRD